MPVAMTGGFGSLPSSLKDKQRQAVLKLLDFNSSDHGEWHSHRIVPRIIVSFCSLYCRPTGLASLRTASPLYNTIGRLRFSSVAREVTSYALTGDGRLSIAELQVH